MATRGMAWHGTARHGMARRGIPWQGIDARSSGEMEELLANLTTNLCVWMEYEFAAAHAVHAAARPLAPLCSCTLVQASE
jgi:hypothetical protein